MPVTIGLSSLQAERTTGVLCSVFSLHFSSCLCSKKTSPLSAWTLHFLQPFFSIFLAFFSATTLRHDAAPRRCATTLRHDAAPRRRATTPRHDAVPQRCSL